MSPESDCYDSPWKDALAEFLQPFLALLFPEVEAEVDWNQEVAFLETELRKLYREAEQGAREADALVEVGLRTGQRGRFWIHVEVQTQWVNDFEERMFIGHHRVLERFGGPVCSLAVIADTSHSWRPSRYHREGFGCRLEFSFPIAKLADYRTRMDELEQSNNPFSVVVAAHLMTQDSRQDQGLRVDFKAELVRSLHRRGFSKDVIRRLFRLIDWMLHLDPPHSLLFEQKLAEYEQEDQMPYISTIEQRGIEKGLEQGLEQGLTQGLSEAILAILAGRFGDVPSTLSESLAGLDAATLKELSLQAATADSIEAFEVRLRQGRP